MSGHQPGMVHPDSRGLGVDQPNAALDTFRKSQLTAQAGAVSGQSPPYPPSGQFKIKCKVGSTGQQLGFLGISEANSVDLVGVNGPYVAICEWYLYDGVNYLRVNNATVYRYLGVGSESSACWGIWTGWKNPVEPRNGGIYLTGTGRTLYPYGQDWAYWGNGITDIAVELIPV